MDLLQPFNSLSLELLRSMSGFGLTQIIVEPTRLFGSGASLIDHVYVSNVSSTAGLYVGAPLGSSDHCSISFSLTPFSPQPRRQTKRTIWLYNKVNFQALNDHLMELMDALPKQFSNTESGWNLFKSTLMSAVKQFIPQRTIKRRKLFLGWISMFCG